MPLNPRGWTHTSRAERARSAHVLVTGSSGVVGRALTRAMKASGYRVVPFDVRSPRRGASEMFTSRDVCDRAAVARAVEGVEGVVHLAAVSRAAPAEADPSLARAVNVEGTRNLLDALRSNGSQAWFLFASSREVYGDPEGLPVEEDHPLRPKGRYGETKAEAEAVVRKYCDGGVRRAMLLRLTNLFGDPHDYAERVVPAFVSAALRGRPLHVRGPQLLIDLLHQEDAVRAILYAVRLLDSGTSGVEVVNVASGRGVTLDALAKKVVSLAGSASPIQADPPVAWAPSGYVGSIAKAARLLSWRPEVDLEEGLKTLVGDFSTVLRGGV